MLLPQKKNYDFILQNLSTWAAICMETIGLLDRRAPRVRGLRWFGVSGFHTPMCGIMKAYANHDVEKDERRRVTDRRHCFMHRPTLAPAHDG